LTACASQPTANWLELEAKASTGDATAQFELGKMNLNNGSSNEAVKWLKMSAENGHAAAQNNLGVLYANGRVLTKDNQEAFRWYKKAARQGLGEAEHNVAWMYDQGLGIPEDNQKAVYWYRRAANHGFQASQLNLGIMLGKGEGVSKDYVEAHKWPTASRMNRADKQAQWAARGALCELEEKMSEQEIEEAGYSYSAMPFSNCESFLSK